MLPPPAPFWWPGGGVSGPAWAIALGVPLPDPAGRRSPPQAPRQITANEAIPTRIALLLIVPTSLGRKWPARSWGSAAPGDMGGASETGACAFGA